MSEFASCKFPPFNVWSQYFLLESIFVVVVCLFFFVLGPRINKPRTVHHHQKKNTIFLEIFLTWRVGIIYRFIHSFIHSTMKTRLSAQLTTALHIDFRGQDSPSQSLGGSRITIPHAKARICESAFLWILFYLNLYIFQFTDITSSISQLLTSDAEFSIQQLFGDFQTRPVHFQN